MYIYIMINPRISNWNDVVSQFGLNTPISPKYKTAYQIYADLIKANKKVILNDDFKGLSIEIEKDNFDSAECIFTFTGTENGRNVYIYNGTVK